MVSSWADQNLVVCKVILLSQSHVYTSINARIGYIPFTWHCKFVRNCQLHKQLTLVHLQINVSGLDTAMQLQVGTVTIYVTQSACRLIITMATLMFESIVHVYKLHERCCMKLQGEMTMTV